MEGELGRQVTPHPIPSVPKKRDFSLQNPSFQPNSNANWKPELWDWDSVRFTVKPSSNELDPKKTTVENSKDLILSKGLGEEGGENLTLKLGGGASLEPAVVRPSKRGRSGSPGSSVGSYPMCQVDDCKINLSEAKDYHRRHKVCEPHSKTAKAVVGRQLQRFCQQCSRFHPLSEFDEGKRSCRRRLAGHNRRRRKSQPEDTTSQLLSPGNLGISGNGNLDIVKLLATLARVQGNGTDKLSENLAVPDRERVIQILNKTHSLPAASSASKSSAVGGFDLNVSQVPQQPCFQQSSKPNGSLLATDLVAVISRALAASSPDAVAALSQESGDNGGTSETKTTRMQSVDASPHRHSAEAFSSVGAEWNRSNLQPQLEISRDPVPEACGSLPLQLFGSAEDDSPAKVNHFRKYVSSESSSRTDDRSPSSSPPVVQELFPVYSVAEGMKDERMSTYREDDAPVEATTSHRWIAPLDLFKESEKRVGSGAVQNPSCQAGFNYSSGSDHSPSSCNSDSQDRTGRIIFKLFDKDPSNFPRALRTQILNWLSDSPSEMESYIRPGCVILSIYASMPCIAWDELERNLLQRVYSLVHCSESEFWRNGKFLVWTDGQLASHNDGKIRLCKSGRSWGAPELAYVSPLAVVGGQETSLVLRGHSLTVPGTKIHCTYMGGYMSISVSAQPGSMYDDSSLGSFIFHGGPPNKFGRCFIEVENGFKGNSFPVIIANAPVCQELRDLESEFEEDGEKADGIPEDQIPPRSREVVLHFLNEIGWLFQRKNIPSEPFLTDFSSARFKFLFTFSVERDWSAVVKTLLDMLVQRGLKGDDSLVQESLAMLVEIQLLNRAVERKCMQMVDLLIHYSVKGIHNDSTTYLFSPNSVGPGGVTPLHLAAMTQDSQDIVDALTNDPQEIGLKCWYSILDDNGLSPYTYASVRNNHPYNELVATKLADRKNAQLSIPVGNQDNKRGTMPAKVSSCAQCAIQEAHRFKPMVRTRGLMQRPYVYSMLAIAAVCVCVCLFLRGSPYIGSIAPFKWENLDYGPR